MKERAKSVLLCLLVLCSLILTGQLWFGRHSEETMAEDSYEPAFFEETRPLEQMILPRRIYVFQEGRCYQARRGGPIFNLFWGELSGMLQEIGGPEYYHDKEGLPPEAELFLSLRFEPLLPLGPESIWLKDEHNGKLAGIQAWRFGERCWIELEEIGSEVRLLLLPPGWGEKLAEFHDRFTPQPSQACELLPEGMWKLTAEVTVSIDTPLYVPTAVQSMDRLSLKPESLDRELLLNTFFIDRHLVREIKEKDGSLIYTDGEQGLRLGSGLEYSHPRPGQKGTVPTYTAALLKAGKEISYHGGWPDNLYLEDFYEQEQGKDAPGGYGARWRSYHGGFPLMGDSAVEMDYYHSLQSYRRNLYEPVDQSGSRMKVRGYRQALKAAVLILETEETAPLTLEEMDLGYYFTGSKAIPVWVIRLGGRELLLKTDELIPPEGWEQ